MEMNNVIQIIQEFPDDTVTSFIRAARKSFNRNTQIDDILSYVQNQHDLPYEHVCDIFGVFVKVIRCYVRNDTNNFRSELLKLGFCNEFVEKLPIYCNDTFGNNITNENKLQSIKWRIDINVNKLNQKRPATVILKLQFTNNSYIIILSLKSLDLLRNNISIVLNELFKFKKQNVMINK